MNPLMRAKVLKNMKLPADEAYDKMKEILLEKDDSTEGLTPMREVAPKENPIKVKPYKYSEGEFILDALAHIDATYGKHYSGGIQTTEFIMSNAESLDFLKGNVFKYVQRYGKKSGNNPEDLYKAVHYICMMYHYSQKNKDQD